jgi:hypothetical protein
MATLRNITIITPLSSQPIKFTSSARKIEELVIDSPTQLPTENVTVKDRNTLAIYDNNSILPLHDLVLFFVPTKNKSGINIASKKDLKKLEQLFVLKVDMLIAKIERLEEVIKETNLQGGTELMELYKKELEELMK